MTTHIPLLVILAAGCSKTDASAPTSKPVETPAVAAPAATPTTPAPAKAKPKASPIEGATALMRKLADGKLAVTDLDGATAFAFVDYSARPQGGHNKVEKHVCGLDDPGARKAMHARLATQQGRVADAFANDAVRCEASGDAVHCDVPASDEHEPSLTFAISMDHFVGFSLRETFMIDDDARLAKDLARRDQAFARLGKELCSLKSP